MTLLVTGSSGFIGRSVCRRLREADLPFLEIPHRWECRQDLEKFLPSSSFDACLHLGWYAHPDDYLVNLTENRSAIDRSLELVGVLQDHGCRHLVVAGSCAEYKPASFPLTEEHPVAPSSIYGAAKAGLHLFLNSCLRQTWMTLSWARIFYVTGPGERSTRFLPSVARRLLEGQTIPLTDGMQQRDYLHVDDVANALLALARARFDGAVNVCSGSSPTIREILTLLATHLGEPSQLRFGELDRGPGDLDIVAGSNDVLRSVGWTPRYTLPETIGDVAEYWRRLADG